MIGELRGRGYRTDTEPTQEDFGWFFTFEFASVEHDVIIGYCPDTGQGVGEWYCFIERSVGLIGTAFGNRRRIDPQAVETICAVLSSSPVVSDARICSRDEL